MQRRGRVVAGAEGGAPRSQRARDLIAYLTESVEPTFARLDAVDCSGLFDTLDITVAPQLPQAKAVPIQFEEPVRLTVWPDDEYAPSIYTTRDDFPLDLVHTSFDEVKGAEYVYWSSQPTHVVMATVSEMAAAAHELKGIHVRRLPRPHRTP